MIDDVPNLGFKGEWAFVKPGYALNKLVPEKKAIFATDEEAKRIKIDVSLSHNTIAFWRFNAYFPFLFTKQQRLFTLFN